MTIVSKALLVGMCNPYGDDPKHALYPSPPNCAGWRVWQLLSAARPDVARTDYARSFDRVNLLTSEFASSWDRAAARSAAERLLQTFGGRDVVLFGNAVRDAFAAHVKDLASTQPGDGLFIIVGRKRARVFFLPHPSGRCHWYNDNANRSAASELLAGLYDLGRRRRAA